MGHRNYEQGYGWKKDHYTRNSEEGRPEDVAGKWTCRLDVREEWREAAPGPSGSARTMAPATTTPAGQAPPGGAGETQRTR